MVYQGHSSGEAVRFSFIVRKRTLNPGYYDYKIVLAYLFRGKKVILDYINEMETNGEDLVIIYSDNLSLVTRH